MDITQFEQEDFNQNDPTSGEPVKPSPSRTAAEKLVKAGARYKTATGSIKSQQNAMGTGGGFVPQVAPSAYQESETAKTEYQSALKEFEPIVNAFNNQTFGQSGEKVQQFITINGAKVPVADPARIREATDQFNKSIGGDVDTGDLLFTRSLAHANKVIVDAKVATDPTRLAEMKKLKGEVIGEDEAVKGATEILKKAATKKETVLGELNNQFSQKQKSIQATHTEIANGLNAKYEPILENISTQLIAGEEGSFNDYKKHLNDQLANREITHKDAEDQLNQYAEGLLKNVENQAQKQFLDTYGVDYKAELNKVTSDYQKQLSGAKADYIAKHKKTQTLLDAEYRTEIENYSQKVKFQNAEVAGKIAKVNKASYDRITKDRQASNTALFHSLETKDIMPYRGNGEAFLNSFFGALGNSAEDIGYFMHGLGVDVPLINKMIGSGAKMSVENNLEVPELSWSNALNPTRIQSLLGQGAGYMAPTAAASILAGNPMAGAFIGTMHNTMINAGDVRKQVLEDGGTPIEANHAMNKMIGLEIAMMPLEFAVAKAFLPAKNGFLKKAGEVMSAEFVQEDLENAGQDAFSDPNKSFVGSALSRKNLLAAGDAAISAGIMGAGGENHSGNNTIDKIKKAVPGADGQWMADIIQSKGIDRAMMHVDALYTNGYISENQRDQFKFQAQGIESKTIDAQTMGLSPAQSQAYIGLSTEHDALKAQAANIKDPILKAAAEKKVAEKEKQVEAVINGEQDLVQVKMPGGTVTANAEDAGKLMAEDDMKAGIASGEIGIVTDDPKINESIEKILADQAKADAEQAAKPKEPVTPQEQAIIETMKQDGVKGTYGAAIAPYLDNPDEHKNVIETATMVVEDNEKEARQIFGNNVVNSILNIKNQENGKGNEEAKAERRQDVLITPPTVSREGMPEYDQFEKDMAEALLNQQSSKFDFVLTIPGVPKVADKVKAANQILSGKTTKANGEEYVNVTLIRKAFKRMHDAGEVDLNRSTGDNAESITRPIGELYNQPTLSSQKEQFAETMDDDTLATIQAEGITLDNIDNLKNLFNGFPYTQDQFESVKKYLNAQASSVIGSGKNSTESGSTSNEDPFPSHAEDKKPIVDADGNRKFLPGTTMPNPKYVESTEAKPKKDAKKDIPAKKEKAANKIQDVVPANIPVSATDEVARRTFLDKIDGKKNLTSDFAVYGKISKENKPKKLAAIAKKIELAHRDHIITDEDYDRLQERINNDYAELGIDPIIAPVEDKKAAKAAAENIQEETAPEEEAKPVTDDGEDTAEEAPVVPEKKRKDVAKKIREAVKKADETPVAASEKVVFAGNNNFRDYKAKFPEATQDEYMMDRYNYYQNRGMAKFGPNHAMLDEKVKPFTNVASALNFIQEQLADDKIAQKALEIFSRLIINNNDIKFDTNNVLGEEGDPLGLYHPDGRLQINYNYHAGNPVALARTVLHELIHAATLSEIEKNGSFGLKLDYVLREIQDALGIEADVEQATGVRSTNAKLIKNLVGLGLIDENKYGGSDTAELVAEIFTNEKFYDYLKGIQYKGDSLIKQVFMKIIDAIKSVFGIEGDSKSMADYLVQLNEDYFKNKKEVQAKWGGAQAMASMKGPQGIFGLDNQARKDIMLTIADGIEAGMTTDQMIDAAVQLVQSNSDFTNKREIKKAVVAEMEMMGYVAAKTKPTQAKININQQTKGSPKKGEMSFRELWKRKIKNQKEGAGIVKELQKSVIDFFKETKVDMNGAAVVKVMNQITKLTNLSNQDTRLDGVLDAVDNIIQSQASIAAAKKVRANIRKAIKSKNRNAAMDMKASVHEFLKINPTQVENINDYLELADRIAGAAKGVTATISEGEGIAANASYDVTNQEIDLYVADHDNYLEELKKDRLVAAYNKLIGVNQIDAADWTLQDLQDIMAAVKGEPNSDPSLLNSESIEKRKAIQAVAEYNRIGVQEWAKDQVAEDLTDLQKQTIDAINKVDMDKLSIKQLAYLNDIMNNIILNSSFANSADALNIAAVQQNTAAVIAKMDAMGYETAPPKPGEKKKVKFADVNHWYISMTTNTAMLFNALTKANKLSSEIKRLSGIDAIFNGHAAADVKLEKAMDAYIEKRDAMGKEFDSPRNRYIRGIYANLARHFGGTQSDQQSEYNRMKGLIQQTYQRLIDSKSMEHQREGMLIKEIYDDIIATSDNINDLRAKLDQKNIDLVHHWMDIYDSNKEHFAEHGAVFNNMEYPNSVNYTARAYKSMINDGIAATDEEKSIFDAAYLNRNIDNKSASSKIKAQKNRELAKNLVLDLDFDYTQPKAYYKTTYDLETAQAVSLVRGFLASPEAITIFGSQENINTVLKSIRGSVLMQKQKQIMSSDLTQAINKTTGYIKRIGASTSLGSVLAPVSQYPSVAVNTMSNLGKDFHLFGKALMMSNKQDIFEILPIGIRGHNKGGYNIQAELEQLSRTEFGNNMKKAADTWTKLSVKLADGVMKMLVSADVSVARTSFLAYYMQDIQRQGIDIADSHFTKAGVNQEAASYAEHMVSITQGANDPTSSARLYRETQDLGKVFLDMTLPFNSFALNMRTRIANDAQKLMRGGNKSEALRSMAGTFAEIAIFQGWKVFGYGVLTTVAANTLAAALGFWDDDDDKAYDEYQEVIIRSGKHEFKTTENFKKWMANSISDFTLSGLGNGFTNATQQFVFNNIYGQIFDEQKIYKGEPDVNKAPFLYANFKGKKQTLLDWSSLGVLGILPARVNEVVKNIPEVVAGQTQKRIKGEDGKEEVWTPITSAERTALGVATLVDFLALLGVSDAAISNANYKLKKQVNKKMEEVYPMGEVTIQKVEKKPAKPKGLGSGGLNTNALKGLNKLKKSL